MALAASEESEGGEVADQSLSDRALLGRIRSGQEDAATLLYLRYADRLRALATSQCSSDLGRRLDPDDIVQSVFRTFFRRVTQGAGYDVPAGDEIWKLFRVIAINKIRTVGAFHRAAKRDVGASVGGEEFDRAVQTQSGSDEMALTVLRLLIEEILAGLPGSHRQIVQLRIEEYDVAEIAHRTQRSKRTVERVLQQFRQSLSTTLYDHKGE